mgnify:CR=1 FL=1
MKIKIYVDYENETVLTESEYKELKTERAKSYQHDDDAFRDWLNDNYEAFEIFNKNGVELDEVVSRWEGVCEADAEEDIDRELTEYELEV